MSSSKFVEDARVIHKIDELTEYWEDNNPHVSDIVDGEGRQYVDLVMEGGGVLGIALVGYTFALEQVGIRFLGIGGASAGAINALALAAIDKPETAKSLRIVEILAKKNMWDFVDGDADAQDFARTIMDRKPGIFKLLWKGGQVVDNLRDNIGLNPGDSFYRWLAHILASHEIRSCSDLFARLSDLPQDIHCRTTGELSPEDKEPRLAIVAAEVTTETKVVFPKMSGLYFGDPDKVNPAKFVRASMSIPFFFHPFRVRAIPKGKAAARNWKEMAGYVGRIPKEVMFIDGGIMSNFPINLFHESGVPKAPTFGVRLGSQRDSFNKIDSALTLGRAIFDASRGAADHDFIRRNPDYRQLVSSIDAGDHHWLNFALSDEAKVDLFYRGVCCAVDFLKNFSWNAYKEVRNSKPR